MAKQLIKIGTVVVALLVFLGGVLVMPGSTGAAVRRALSIDDPELSRYAIRVRATGKAMLFFRKTLVDMMSRWANPGDNALGANSILDGGYDYQNFNAGIVRSTPMQWSYGSSNIRRTDQYVCETCSGTPEQFSFFCGQTCTNLGSTYEAVGWSQVRKPGFNSADTPVVITQAGGYNGFGFFVPESGDYDPCTGNAFDFVEYQVCSSYYGYDIGSGKAGMCTDPPQSGLLGLDITLDFNARIFIFPNMWQESGGCVDNSFDTQGCTRSVSDPSYPSYYPAVRGCYTGLDAGTNPAPTVVTTSFTAQACATGGGCANNDGCCGIIDVWGICSTTAHTAAYCNAKTTMAGSARIPQPPNSVASYNSALPYNQLKGVYFRQGDDQAIYLNIFQMQVQSRDRASFTASAVPDCGLNERVYSGVVGNVVQYMDTGDPVYNCMRPKSYYKWADPSSPEPLQQRDHWEVCKAFDTWMIDGAYNTSNDDAKYVYPANPATGAPYTPASPGPGVCGNQKCTAYDATVFTGPPSTWNKAPCNGLDAGGLPFPDLLRRTNRSEDVFEPGAEVAAGSYTYTDPGNAAYRYNGSGWYGLSVAPLVMNPAAETIGLALAAKDVRIEVGAAADLRATVMIFGAIPVTVSFSNQVAMGELSVKALNLIATVSIRGIDNTSCVPAQPATCTSPWGGTQDNKNNPDILNIFFDVPAVGGVDIVPYGGGDPTPPDMGNKNWINGKSTSAINLIVWNPSLMEILNMSFVAGMMIPILEDAIQGIVGPALGDLLGSAIPPLSSVFGDPISMGTVLLEPGLFSAGEPLAKTGTPPVWPAYIQAGPSATRATLDMRFMLGFKPLAFRPTPVGPNNIMDLDTNDPPLNDSIYGFPKLITPSTMGCGYVAPGTCVPRTGCNLPPHGIKVDYDMQFDQKETCVGGTATYINPRDNSTVTIPYPQVIPQFWQGPIPPEKRPPVWCMAAQDLNINAPATIRRNGGPTDMAELYPQTTWLSFDATYDRSPSNLQVPKNTFGDWDEMRANTVLKQNSNMGNKDAARIGYDVSMHIHQRTLAAFMQALVSSGALCIEFASTDAAGVETPWASMLDAERFSAFVPEISSLFPNSKVKVRLSPMDIPHIRTGMGRLTYMPRGRLKDPMWGPLPIVNEPYALGVAIPDLRIEIVADNKGTDVSIVTLYWNSVVGIFAKAVRTCLPKDPLFGTEACNSTRFDKRTVSGYWEFYLDLNSPALAAAWENGRDGFPVGKFTNPGIGITKDEAAFSVVKTYCQVSSRCKLIGLTQAVPALMNSMISMFLATRFTFMNFTVDFLYMGPDGPNDDFVGGGDYLGLYLNLLGDLDLLDIIGTMGLLAPAQSPQVRPMAVIAGGEESLLVNNNSPELPVELTSPLGSRLGVESELSYTYSIDAGFWHSPVNDKQLALGVLTEGEHSVELRAIDDNELGTVAARVPTRLKLVVDSVPPEISIKPASGEVYKSRVGITLSDLQTPTDEIKREYRWTDRDEWTSFDGDSVSVRGLPDGRHTLYVRATDLAGNRAEAARVIVTEYSFWSCSATPGNGVPVEFVLIFGMLLIFRVARRRGR